MTSVVATRGRVAALAVIVALAVIFPTVALSQGQGQGTAPAPAGKKQAPAEQQAPAGQGGQGQQGQAQDKQGKGKKGQPEPAPEEPETLPDGTPKIDARAWILIDPRDGEVLASKAENTPRPIASTTKLMTAYVVLKKLKPSKVITVPPYNAGAAESLMGIQEGEQLTVRDLLYGLILESGNDAANALAVGTSGDVPTFVEQMNAQADALGLVNTSYANPVGLDEAQNYSTAADLAELATQLLKNPLFARIADSQTATTRSGNTTRRLETRNTLLNSDPTADGVKTGRTIGAGYVLVASATRDGTQLVSAVLGARSEAARDAESEKLLDYGFSQYKASTPVKRGEEIADPELDYRSDTLGLLAQKPIQVSARQGQPVETVVDAPDEVSGDVEQGEALGTVVVTVDGRRAGKTNLIAAESVDAATTFDKAKSFVSDPKILIPGGLAVIVVGMLVATKGRRRTRRPAPQPPAASGPAGSGRRASAPAPPSPPGVAAPKGKAPASQTPGGQPPAGQAPAAPPAARPKPAAPAPPEEESPKKRTRLKRRSKAPVERTPEERRKMHEERQRRRQQRARGEDR